MSRWVEYEPAANPQLHWIEHEPLRFPGYPHEISALQLYDAAKLTLSLALDALQHGWVLKDASAWNVLFDRGRPVFCDVLSFEPAVPTTTWMAYAQFQRCFTIPLLLNRVAGIAPRTWFLLEREGLSPEAARHMLSWRAAWTQPGLEAVTLPALLNKWGQRQRARHAVAARTADTERGRSVMGATLRRLSGHIDSLKPTTRDSVWVEYESTRDHYQQEDLLKKTEFVRHALSDAGIHSVLDLGCNAGEFSVLAADLGKSVVAVDGDDASIHRLYQRLREAPRDISPMVLNIARPTPALGWMNAETGSFMERATARFDCVLALGLVHHLAITERAPLALIVELLHRLTTGCVIVEWVEPQDPRFRQLAGPNLTLYESLTRLRFETLMQAWFTLQSSQTLPSGTRVLYRYARQSVLAV